MKAKMKYGLHLVCLLTLVGMIGCQNDNSAKVEGKVTYQGQVVPRGSVVIQDATGALHTANLTPEGTFRVVGVGLGAIKVAVQIPKHLLEQGTGADSLAEAQKAKEADASEGERVREAEVPSGYVMPIPIPEKYNSLATSGLEFELTSDRATWELQIVLE